MMTGYALKTAVVSPLWFYRWIPGVSRQAGAIVVNGKTLYGPIAVSRPADRYTAGYLGGQAARRIGWIDDADFSNPLNAELFHTWQARAVAFALEAARAARGLY